MSTRSLFITLLTVTFVPSTAAKVQACWLTDWLHGHSAPTYVAGYPASAANGSYAAGYAPLAAPSGYAAGYAPARTSRSVLPLATRSRRPTYSLQRPAYGDNPSVYTGQPVTQSSRRVPVASGSSVYAARSVPVARSLRGAATPSNAYYGTGNVYPDNNAAASGYAAASPRYLSASPGYASSAQAGSVQTGTVQPSTPAGGALPLPSTALPRTNVAPLYGAPRRRRGGLARFFSSLLGTNYRSSYYRAPVTYYRPATTVDPVTGSTVTVQRPCTSSVQQLQRTPYRSLQMPSSAPAAAPPPADGCQPSVTQPQTTYGQSTYGQSTDTSPGLAPPANGQPRTLSPGLPSGVSPAGGYSGGQAAPIPSTSSPSTAPSRLGEDYRQPGGAPNTAPLTGSPPATGGGNDRAPVDQPQLESRRRRSTGVNNEPNDADRNTSRNRNGSSSGTSDNDGESRQEQQDTTSPGSSFRFQRHRPKPEESMATQTPPSLDSTGRASEARPIPAPGDYRSPFGRREATAQHSRPSTDPTSDSSLNAPPLPPRNRAPADSTSTPRQRSWEQQRVSVPVREAALESRRISEPAATRPVHEDSPVEQPQRDRKTSSQVTGSSGWYSLDP